MAFEKFNSFGLGRTGVTIPFVSIWRGAKQLAINVTAQKVFEIKPGQHCNLFYDKDNHQMAIQVMPDGVVTGIRLRSMPSGLLVSIGGFMRVFNLTWEKSVRYPISKDEKTGFLIIKFDDGIKRGDQ